jgi:tetraacyldisaccharide 4'-kinase
MNFNSPLLKLVRILLFPFSLAYWLVIFIRNTLYKYKIFQSVSFPFPIICVGNISAGGTGKTPMVEYLLQRWNKQYQMATISRGYKRKSTGYVLANTTTTAMEIGDEPMQFFTKFPLVTVVVGEERLLAIARLLQHKPTTQLIVLDDAFQHRAVNAGFNIVLTDYNNLYINDWYLPTGNLRDEKRSIKRAQVVVVTKCPTNLSVNEKNTLVSKINPVLPKQVFFTSIRYGQPYQLISREQYNIDKEVTVILVSGIANPLPLQQWVRNCSKNCVEMSYADHHLFSEADLKNIEQTFKSIAADRKIILTTEKDAVRLQQFAVRFSNAPWYAVPIHIEWLFNGASAFDNLVQHFIETRMCNSA